METKKQKWWIIPLVLVLAAALLLGLFWDTVKVYLTPKTVLSAALSKTAEELQDRFSGSPLHVLAAGVDDTLCNTVTLQMDKADDLLGNVHYDLSMQTQLSPRRVLAKGTAATGTSTLDLSLYLDEDFAAIASEGLLGGNYYGITYDTFSQDIRGNGVLAFLLGEDTISEWEFSVAGLADSMGKTMALPEFSREDLSMAMMGLMAMKAEVSRETVELTRSKRECFRIHFQVDGAVLLGAAEYAQMALPVTITEESVLTADFYLAEDLVVRCDVALSGPESFSVNLMGDVTPLTDPLRLRLDLPGDEKHELRISTISSESLYTEEITHLSGDEQSILHYSWNRESGDGQLSRAVDGGKHTVSMNLLPTETGFRIETGDLDALLAILGEGEDEADTPCVLTVAKGSGFDTPGYKNLDQWSLQDLLALLGGIGGLLGLQI